ncbi:MAG: YggT family protein [Alphaproteobacteria bacterium]|nr:YggT family protein [Alphaproteobacteria bacterium]
MTMAIGKLLLLALDIFFWIIIIQVALSWLIVFNVINVSNPQARNFIDLLQKVTDPIFRPLRKYIPPIGGIDITPIVVIFGIYLLQSLVISFFMTPTVLLN